MDPILKNIKQTLKPKKKQLNLTFKHLKNHVQDKLLYTKYFGLNRKKHFLQIQLILQQKEQSLSMLYTFAYDKKDKDIEETYSLMNYQDTSFPGMKDLDVSRLERIYQFEAKDHHIENSVSLEEQANTLLEILDKNLEHMVTYVKQLER